MKIRRTLLGKLLVCTSCQVFADNRPAEKQIGFNDHIRPILSTYCFACHGPDSASRQADLRLDEREAAIASGALVPGRADDSEIIARINSNDPDYMMPPKEFLKSLPAEEKQRLADWIDEGAAWEKHWAFIKPERPRLPVLPGIESWKQNAIDHFILRGIRARQLQPNQPADRYSLARRAALDITGLPPTRKALEAFIADQSDRAYEYYVDRLLASPRAAEHRARYWLDAARYGDTHGMHVDNYREIWPYRDWVIQAFNSNMPFDQFVVEQIAGDLIPEPTLEQRIATGFNRCNITTSEGGAIPEEVNVRYMIDRVETMATVFLGLTAGCAVCHDHKYDPITQREFYQLGAFFNNSTQPAMDGNQKDTPPVVTLPGPEYQREWEQVSARRQQLRQDMKQREPASEVWWPVRSESLAESARSMDLILSLPFTRGEVGTVAKKRDGQETLEPLPYKLHNSMKWAADHPAGRRGVRFAGGPPVNVDLPELRSDQPLTISFWFRTPDRLLSTTLFDHTAKTENEKVAGWKISSSTQGAVTFEMTDLKGNKIRALLPGEEALRPRSWQHVCVRYSGGQSNSSISILVNGEPGVLRNSTEEHIGATVLPDIPLKIASRLPTAGLSDVRIFRRWLVREEVEVLAHDYDVNQLLRRDASWDGLPTQDRNLLAEFHKTMVDPQYRAWIREFAATERRRDYIYSRSTTTLVSQERDTDPRAWVLERGEYDQRREEVAPGIPVVLQLPGFDSKPTTKDARQRRANRLDLAQWLIHPDHPLTARVMVNRLWQSVFGVGLVKTSEDFGVMGERPSHPELLDWLAVEFVESGWDVKHILKLIVTSATYRQSNIVTPEKLAADPANRLLARGPRIRLDAEVLRDQVLAVSGLLNLQMGGPSVKPYQPAGLWKVVAITGSNTRVFSRDEGDALYRRSVYTFWKRTAPPPSMAAFNAPTREQCTVRRERTNTPIQALVLMNDPQYVEAARRLAETALNQFKDDHARASFLLTTVLARPAVPVDISELVIAAEKLRIIFKEQPKSANGLIHTGDSVPDKNLDSTELAVWTMVANTIMNRDDFINN